MNNTKEKKAKLQITMAVMVLTVVFFGEMYLMINFPTSYLPIIGFAVVALIAVYVIVIAVMTINEEKENIRNEHFENIYRSEKASYIMLKKSFDEIDERLNELQEISKVPAEEIINAQKGIAKVIINRSKENADAIINSNDQVLERLDEVEETQNTKFTSLSKEQRLKLTDMGTQTDIKFQDLLVQLKDTELRLNQAIMSGSKVVMQAAPTPAYVMPSAVESESIVEEKFGVPEVLEELDEIVEPEEMEEVLSIEDLIKETDNQLLDVDELLVEEKPPMPDLSDPNKVMSPDEIAALIANL